MHALQSYKQKELFYDNNAYTISSTYHGGQLKLYTHHIIPSTKKGRESETIMTQIKGYSMTSDYETFVRGASAYRNLRDWAKEQRNEFIEAANERYLKPQSESQPTSEQGTISELTVTVDDVETLFESDEPEFHNTAQYSFACSFLATEEEPHLHTDSGEASIAESSKGRVDLTHHWAEDGCPVAPEGNQSHFELAIDDETLHKLQFLYISGLETYRAKERPDTDIKQPESSTNKETAGPDAC
ncbi:hypothetical protein FQN57_001800 [Myotisia sp. PD_48]|nr:hypothetical protein FQN57_001800 [Myotisia sp. PD_48]